MHTQEKKSNELLELSKLNALFIKNFLTNDVESHEGIIHPRFTYISNKGKVVERDEYLKAWASGYDPKVDLSFEYFDERINVFGEFALIRCFIQYTRLEQNQVVERREVYTDTYVKEGGKWSCVQAQLTVVVP